MGADLSDMETAKSFTEPAGPCDSAFHSSSIIPATRKRGIPVSFTLLGTFLVAVSQETGHRKFQDAAWGFHVHHVFQLSILHLPLILLWVTQGHSLLFLSDFLTL